MEYKSKVDLIYEALINDITSGVYQSGDRLVIRRIAKENSISEIPVREAIRRLESEGYVNISANQGARVSLVTKADVIEIFQLKGLLEGYAARLAIDYLKPEDYAALRKINEELKEATESKDYSRCGDLNVQFHLNMYACLPQKRLYDMIKELWKKWQITKSVFRLSPERSLRAVTEHEEILSLMEQKKYDESELCVRWHKFHAGNEMAKCIKSSKE